MPPQAPLDIGRRALSAAQRPERTVSRVREALEGFGEVAWANLNPAPETPLNVPIGPHRRIWWQRADLEDFKIVKNGSRFDDALTGQIAASVLIICMYKTVHSAKCPTTNVH